MEEADTTPRDCKPFLAALLEHLDDNRQFPKYQYERRIDAFVSFFLRDVLTAKGIITKGDVQIPEFPIDAEYNSSNLSKNVDYFVFDASQSLGCFVELKTDHSSCDFSQLETYARAFGKPWLSLNEDIEQMRKASDKKQKYRALQDRLSACPECTTMKLVYIAPEESRRSFDNFLADNERPNPSLVSTASWSFLSLTEFAGAKIEGCYQDEWSVVHPYITRIDTA